MLVNCEYRFPASLQILIIFNDNLIQSFKILFLYRLHHILGSGQFGEVYKATWNIDQHSLELAVKTLKSGASEEDSVKFLQEAAIMGQFKHTNVITMYGVVNEGELANKPKQESIISFIQVSKR